MGLRPFARWQVALASIAVVASAGTRWLRLRRRTRPSHAGSHAVGRLGPTLAAYRALHEGLGPDAVTALVGREGQVLNHTEAHGISTVTREWRTDDGRGRLYVVFQGARLVAKSQDGLT